MPGIDRSADPAAPGPAPRPMPVTCRPPQAGGMYLIYAPLFLAFIAFVVYGGIVLPAREIADSVKGRR